MKKVAMTMVMQKKFTDALLERCLFFGNDVTYRPVESSARYSMLVSISI